MVYLLDVDDSSIEYMVYLCDLVVYGCVLCECDVWMSSLDVLFEGFIFVKIGEFVLYLGIYVVFDGLVFEMNMK